MATRHPRGMALVAVLWIVSLLALMAAGAGSSGRVSSLLAFNAIESAKARLLAEGGIHRAVYRLLTSDLSSSSRIDGGLDLSFDVLDDPIAVQVRDEDGKIDVNTANSELLAGLLAAVGMEAGQAAPAMAARIVDYRDDDSSALPSGAEDPAYKAAGLAHGTADRPLRHLEELRQVLGMTDSLYARLHPHMTVYTHADGLDPRRASNAALVALPGMTPDIVAAIRANDDPDADLLLTLPGEIVGPVENYILPSRDLVFEV
ncbi:MAG: general secretion pathway protein GspK, partial [Geminicoccaceae bacterium]